MSAANLSQASFEQHQIEKNSRVEMTARPPLTAIFVFCAAARHGSFKRAAEELNVTPGAVSRQIHALEEYLGHKLFERSPRSLQLTAKGARLQERVADKMMSIGAEIDLLRSGSRKKIIRLDAGVTVGMHWLIPRLSSFAEAEAGIQVQISTSDGPIDLSRRIDLYIRRDISEFRGLKSTKFLDEHSVLVASPKFMGRTAFSPDAIARCTRIGAKSRPDLWRQWSAYQKLAPTEYEPTLEFDNTVLAIQATVEGLGVMVVPEIFIASVLGSRLLELLGSVRVPTGTYSYAIHERRDSGSVRKFADWIGQC